MRVFGTLSLVTLRDRIKQKYRKHEKKKSKKFLLFFTRFPQKHPRGFIGANRVGIALFPVASRPVNDTLTKRWGETHVFRILPLRARAETSPHNKHATATATAMEARDCQRESEDEGKAHPPGE